MWNKVEIFSFSNISATPASFTLRSGNYGVTVTATFGGGNVALQRLSPDGTTYVTVMTAFTAAGYQNAYLRGGTYRLLVTTATAIYVDVVSTSPERPRIKSHLSDILASCFALSAPQFAAPPVECPTPGENFKNMMRDHWEVYAWQKNRTKRPTPNSRRICPHGLTVSSTSPQRPKWHEEPPFRTSGGAGSCSLPW